MVDNADNTTKKATQAQVTNSVLPQDLNSTGQPTFSRVVVNGIVFSQGRRQQVAVKSTNYTLTINDEVVVFTATATATLPTPTGSGQTYRIICRSGVLTIAGLVKGDTQILNEGEDIIITDTGVWE